MKELDEGIDGVIKRLVNDPDINRRVRCIFTERKWKALREKFEAGDIQGVISEIQKKVARLKKALQTLQEAVRLTESLKNSVKETPELFREIVVKLNEFGVFECNLPDDMGEFGRVIELHGRTIGRQFFIVKIADAETRQEKRALRKALEYAEELHELNLNLSTVGFFVQNFPTTARFAEVLLLDD